MSETISEGSPMGIRNYFVRRLKVHRMKRFVRLYDIHQHAVYVGARFEAWAASGWRRQPGCSMLRTECRVAYTVDSRCQLQLLCSVGWSVHVRSAVRS